MSDGRTAPEATRQERQRIDLRKLARECLAILRAFDKWALIAAVVALIVMVIVNVSPLLAILLSPAVYVGAALARPRRSVSEPIPDPPKPEEEQAFARAGAATANIMSQAALIRTTRVRRQVRAVGTKFGKMLDVMQEDRRFASAPDYYDRLVHGFEQQLVAYVRMIERKVALAESQIEHFEQNIVPRTLQVAEAFYQSYHLDDVIDLAALMELHKLNLDNLDGAGDDDREDAAADGAHSDDVDPKDGSIDGETSDDVDPDVGRSNNVVHLEDADVRQVRKLK
jgi:hypothetical protein